MEEKSIVEKQDVGIDQLLEYIYYSAYENYDHLMQNKNVADVLDVNTNNMCKKLRLLNPESTDREIKCKSFTLLYMLLLMTF